MFREGTCITAQHVSPLPTLMEKAYRKHVSVCTLQQERKSHAIPISISLSLSLSFSA